MAERHVRISSLLHHGESTSNHLSAPRAEAALPHVAAARRTRELAAARALGARADDARGGAREALGAASGARDGAALVRALTRARALGVDGDEPAMAAAAKARVLFCSFLLHAGPVVDGLVPVDSRRKSCGVTLQLAAELDEGGKKAKAALRVAARARDLDALDAALAVARAACLDRTEQAAAAAAAASASGGAAPLPLLYAACEELAGALREARSARRALAR